MRNQFLKLGLIIRMEYKFKRKFEKTGIAKQVKARQFYVKPSEKEREKKAKSLYKQQRITKSLNA